MAQSGGDWGGTEKRRGDKISQRGKEGTIPDSLVGRVITRSQSYVRYTDASAVTS